MVEEEGYGVGGFCVGGEMVIWRYGGVQVLLLRAYAFREVDGMELVD
jgi:hypothetical protein